MLTWFLNTGNSTDYNSAYAKAKKLVGDKLVHSDLPGG